MPKCPGCKREISKAEKSWTYGPFRVKAYSCQCGTDFREYIRNGEIIFILKREKGEGRYKKV
jgi:hypothetical protein